MTGNFTTEWATAKRVCASYSTSMLTWLAQGTGIMAAAAKVTLIER